jgi:hypothetical protein
LISSLQVLADNEFHLETSLEIDNVLLDRFFDEFFVVVAVNGIGVRSRQIDVQIDGKGE